MRHNRSESFARALEGSEIDSTKSRRWHEIASDPNDPAVLAARASVLRDAWRPSIPDRIEFIVGRCRDRRVLDIGCVAHDMSRVRSESWLHGRISLVAHECIGVDVLPDAVNELNALGYHVVEHDLSVGHLGPLADIVPVDVIVAGELIEHVSKLDMLFETASRALTEDGQLIVTTPNPYAPHRVRAGQLGIVWENVDHIMYAFPSGMAELAERHGLVLTEATTTRPHTRRRDLLERAKRFRRLVRGTRYISAGYASVGPARPVRVHGWTDRIQVGRLMARRRRFVGESFVYVVRRPEAVGRRARHHTSTSQAKGSSDHRPRST